MIGNKVKRCLQQDVRRHGIVVLALYKLVLHNFAIGKFIFVSSDVIVFLFFIRRTLLMTILSILL